MREQLASTPEPSLQKEKEQSGQSKVPNHKVGESHSEREPHLGEREGGSEQAHVQEKVVSTVNKDGF